MDKKDFDKAALEEGKERHKLKKVLDDGGNYTSKTFDPTNMSDWEEKPLGGEVRYNTKNTLNNKNNKISVEDELNLAIYTEDDTKRELIIIMDPNKQYEKYIVKRIPKMASAIEGKMLIDHWLVQYDAFMVEVHEHETLDIRQNEKKSMFNKPHITER